MEDWFILVGMGGKILPPIYPRGSPTSIPVLLVGRPTRPFRNREEARFRWYEYARNEDPDCGCRARTEAWPSEMEQAMRQSHKSIGEKMK